MVEMTNEQLIAMLIAALRDDDGSHGVVEAAVLARMVEPEEGSEQEYRARLAKLHAVLKPGQAVVEWCGREERFGVERFVAHVVFPLGPPDDLRFDVVWDAKPVRIVLDALPFDSASPR